LPAKERFAPHDPEIGELDDRLVVEPELVAVEGTPEVCLELQP
jgi:hypothetical protein